MMMNTAVSLIAIGTLLLGGAQAANTIEASSGVNNRLIPKITKNQTGIASQDIRRLTLEKIDEEGLEKYPIVQVFSSAASPGSGVIIAALPGGYAVLTSKHVIGSLAAGESIEIKTLDGLLHNASLAQSSRSMDAALLEFRSSKKYYPAYIDIKHSPRKSDATIVAGYSLASKEVTRGTFRISNGSLVAIVPLNKDGYDYAYSNATTRGMSGGAVYVPLPRETKYSDDDEFDITCEKWGPTVPRLVAIHGRAESYGAGEAKSGVALGISMPKIIEELSRSLSVLGFRGFPPLEKTALFSDLCYTWSRDKDS